MCKYENFLSVELKLCVRCLVKLKIDFFWGVREGFLVVVDCLIRMYKVLSLFLVLNIVNLNI